MEILWNALLPFFFVFSVVYGALEVSGVFGKRANTLIAVIIGFFAISSPMLVEFLNQTLPFAVIFFIGFFFLSFIVKFAGKPKEKDYTLIMVIIGLILLLFATQGQDIIENYFSIPQESITNIFSWIILIFIFLLFFAAYKYKSE